MYYPRKIPEHFLKTTDKAENHLPLTTQEQTKSPKNISPLAVVLLLEFLAKRKEG